MCVWSTALKLGCVYTNLCTLFLVMGLISLVNKIQFMLISSPHICIRSMEGIYSSLKALLMVVTVSLCFRHANYQSRELWRVFVNK